MRRHGFLLFATALLCCSSCVAVAQDKPKMVTITEEHEFKTIRFRITRTKTLKAPDGTDALLIWFGGLWSGRQTEIGLSLSLDWRQPTPKPPFPMWVTELGLARVGTESDDLVRQLSIALGSAREVVSMKEDVFFTAVLLGEKPASFSPTYQLKLFHEGKNEAEYAEVYVHINTAAGTVIFSEKDQEYRAPLISALAEVK